MSDKTKVKYVSDFEIEDTNVMVKKPFKLKKENNRRFVRIEISAPVSMRNLKDDISCVTNDTFYSIEGTILNISANGVLIEMHDNVAENDIIMMKFTIQDVKKIDAILGMVKRIDSVHDNNLVGISFLAPSSLEGRLSDSDIKLLEEHISSFNDKVYDTIKKYIYKK